MVLLKNFLKFVRLVFITILTMFLICSCGISQPNSVQLLSEELDSYIVRTTLSLNELNKTMSDINLAQDPLPDFRILEAEMKQFRILAKPEIFLCLKGTPGNIRNQVVIPELWTKGVSDIPDIYYAVDHILDSVVEPLIEKLEHDGKIEEQDILTWDKIKKNFFPMIENFQKLDGEYSQKIDSSEVEAVKKSVENAKILQQINL